MSFPSNIFIMNEQSEWIINILLIYNIIIYNIIIYNKYI